MSENVSLGTVSAEVKIGLSQVAASRAKLAAELGQIGGALDRMADQAEKDGKRAEDALARAADTKKLAKLRAELAATKQSQMQLWSEMGRGATLAGGAITGAMIGATAAASKFDGAMRNVNSLAKMNEKQFQATSKAVLGLVDDKRITDGPAKLAEGLYDIYGSGKQGADALETLKVSAMGASAGLTDTATSSRVLMAVLNSGIPGVKSAQEAMDVLFREVDLGVNNFEQLAGSIGMVLPQAKLMGVSLQEVAAALATMTRQGLSASEATTSLNNLLSHIAKPGKEAAKTMDELGISYGATALETKGLSGWLDEAIAKTHGNKDALMKLVPELRGLRGELILASENGKLYKEMLAGMGDATKGVGATQAALNEQMKSATYQAAKAKQELERMAVEIGQHLLPIARDLMKELHGATSAFHELSPATQGAIVKFGLFGGAILLVFGRVVDLILKLGELKALMATSGVTSALSGAGSAFAGTAVGGALISTAPVTLPLIAGGAIAYGVAQDSIANSERQQANLTLPNRERITFLQGEIAKKQRIIKQFPVVNGKTNPIVKRHQADIDQMQREMETLQYTGITASVRGAAKAKSGGKPKPPANPAKPAVDQDALDKAAADAQRAREAEADLKLTKLKDEFDSELQGWDGVDPAGRARLVHLSDLIAAAEDEKANIAYSGSRADGPKAAAADRSRATYTKAQGKGERSSKIREKASDSLEKQRNDSLGADREAMERDIANEKRNYRGLLESYEGNNPLHREALENSSDKIRLYEKRLAQFDLGLGVKSELSQAKHQTAMEQVKQGVADRTDEIAKKDTEAQERADKAAIKGFEEWASAQEKKRKIGERWAADWEKSQEKVRAAEERRAEQEARDAERLERQLDRLAAKLEELQRGPLTHFNESLASGVGESIAHFRSLEDFLTGWKNRVGAMLQGLAAEMITDWARLQITGRDKETGAGGKDTALGQLGQVGQLAGLFSRKKAGPAAGGGQSTEDYGWGPTAGGAPAGPDGVDNALGAASMIPGVGAYAAGALALKKLFRFAEGGVMMPGVPAMIGDSHQAANGEWVIPRVPSLAIPASMLDQIAGRAASQMGGGGDTQIIVHVGSISSQVDIETLGQQIAWHQDQRKKVS